jgi:hypothetical protein
MGDRRSLTPLVETLVDRTTTRSVLDDQQRGGHQGFDGVRAELIELGLPDRKPLAAVSGLG